MVIVVLILVVLVILFFVSEENKKRKWREDAEKLILEERLKYEESILRREKAKEAYDILSEAFHRSSSLFEMMNILDKMADIYYQNFRNDELLRQEIGRKCCLVKESCNLPADSRLWERADILLKWCRGQ